MSSTQATITPNLPLDLAPSPTLSVDVIEGDNFITNPEIADNVIFSGHETGIAADKPLVFKIREGSPDQFNDIRPTIFTLNAVRSGEAWQVKFTPEAFTTVGNGSYTATISDPALGTSALRVFHVDHNDPNQPDLGDPPASPFLTYEAVEGDNIVTQAELADGVVLHGHTKDIPEGTTLNLYLRLGDEEQVIFHPIE
jgi:hypothetical protein